MANLSNRPQPLTLEEIDPDWLTAALRKKYPDVTVKNVEIVDINHGTCSKIRLKLDMDEAGKRAGIPETVMLKGGFEPHSRSMYHMHLMEVRGYRDVYSVMNALPTPKCFYADNDEERKQGIIIMEDLVPRKVKFCNPQRPQSYDEVAWRLRLLAKHHALTWDTPEFNPGGKWDWVPEDAPGVRYHMDQYLNPSEWQRFVDAPRGAAASVRFHDRLWMIDALDRMIPFAKKWPHVVVQGDTHLGNLFQDADGTPGFFDSLPGRSPAMQEISYHMVCALDLADRRKWEGGLVQHYLDELKLHGVKPFSFEDAMLQYAVYLARGYIVFLVNEAFYQKEAINTAYVARFSQAMLDHDTIGLLKAIG
jgi:hypothetical protein